MVSAESQHAMDAAKQAVAEFMKRNGHHDTTVHERVLPAVTHQTITKTEHEEIEVAVDREQHVDHFHFTIQPVTDSETLDVQHRAHVLPIESKTFEHDDREEVHRRVAAEGARFRDEVLHVEGEHARTDLHPLESQHMHHHVFEVIQPILNKHTIEPWIVHTAHQVHEIHHLAARHHQTSMLPAVTLAEFKKQGGILTGREERHDFFQGEPKSSGGVLGDSQTNPFPRELRAIGHEDVAYHTSQHQEHSQAAPPVPTITRAPTGQGNLVRQPTAHPALPTQPQPQPQPTQPAPAPASHDLHAASAGSQQAPQAPALPQAGTPSTSHFGLMPLQLARSAHDAVRAAPMLRSISRTPQATAALSAPQSSAAQQASQAAHGAPAPQSTQSAQQQQRQGSSAGVPQPQPQAQQGKAPGQQQQGQQQSGR